jgi:hypothetical protein
MGETYLRVGFDANRREQPRGHQGVDELARGLIRRSLG